MNCRAVAVLLFLQHTAYSFRNTIPRLERAVRHSVPISAFQLNRNFMSRSGICVMMAPAGSGSATIKIPDIEVYSTLGCKYCRIAKAKLEELGVVYYNVDVEEYDVPPDAPNVPRQVLVPYIVARQSSRLHPL